MPNTIPTTMTKNRLESEVEMVMVVDRHELSKQGVGTNGIYPFSLNAVSPSAFGYLARGFADNKSPTSIEIGKVLPQILGYFQITDKEGRILTYRRKGKEEGLLGKYSIGVGGHVDLTDGLWMGSSVEFVNRTAIATTTQISTLGSIGEIVCRGARRELEEEIGVRTDLLPSSAEPDYDSVFDVIISTFADPTSTVHVGLPRQIMIDDVDSLKYDESEFNEVEWLTKDELKALKEKLRQSGSGLEFETWSALLIDFY